MIAITDISAYSDLDHVGTNNTLLIPTQSEIQTLIGSNAFVNTAITTAFKNLLIQISNESIYNNLPLKPASLLGKIGWMFNRIGFSRQNGILIFQPNTGAFDSGTEMIINSLNSYDINKDFEKIAHDAFHSSSDNDWAKEANHIRAMENTGLQKLYYITVYSNSNSDDSLNFTTDINNSENILNRRNESTQRFLMINLDENADPVMPTVRVKNNSNERIRIRLKVYYEKTANANGTGQITRRSLDYFPETGDPLPPPFLNNHSIIINPNEYKDISYGDKIRGGDATIEYIPESLNWNVDWGVNDSSLFKFKFYIRGENPTRNNVIDYLTNSSYIDQYWFLSKMTKHESGSFGQDYLNSGNSPENRRYKHFNYGANYSVNNNQIGLPNMGYPKGFGLFQLDNFGKIPLDDIQNQGLLAEFNAIQPGGSKAYQTLVDNLGRTFDRTRDIVPSDNEVWNWKRNIDRAIVVINEKRGSLNSNTLYIGWIQSINTWNNNNPTNLVTKPVSREEGHITFDNVPSTLPNISNIINNYFNDPNNNPDIIKCFFDASVLKYYNGASGGGHYLVRRINTEGKPYWAFNLINSEGFNYVNRVCATNED